VVQPPLALTLSVERSPRFAGPSWCAALTLLADHLPNSHAQGAGICNAGPCLLYATGSSELVRPCRNAYAARLVVARGSAASASAASNDLDGPAAGKMGQRRAPPYLPGSTRTASYVVVTSIDARAAGSHW